MTARGYYAGYLTSSKTLIRFEIPCVMVSGVTPSASGSWGIIVRQNGSYIVGSSSASESISASNISFTNRDHHIAVEITVSVSDSATNNDTVGVQIGSGTIAFS